MIKPIVTDPIFLARRARRAENCDADKRAARDLLDTLAAHSDGCVGMAANMIGESLAVIVFAAPGGYETMFNPEIIKCDGAFSAEEGCLSLTGTRKAKRYASVKIRFQNLDFQVRTKTYTGWTAQIIQHEIDHCNGILI